MNRTLTMTLQVSVRHVPSNSSLEEIAKEIAEHGTGDVSWDCTDLGSCGLSGVVVSHVAWVGAQDAEPDSPNENAKLRAQRDEFVSALVELRNCGVWEFDRERKAISRLDAALANAADKT